MRLDDDVADDRSRKLDTFGHGRQTTVMRADNRLSVDHRIHWKPMTKQYTDIN